MKKYFSLLFFPFLPLMLPPVLAVSEPVDPCTGEIVPVGCPQGGEVSIGTVLGAIMQFAFIIAVILALAFIIYGGIRWITSGGDKGGVETARNTIISAIIGLIVVVLAYFVINNLVLPFLGLPQGFVDLDQNFPTLFSR